MTKSEDEKMSIFPALANKRQWKLKISGVRSSSYVEFPLTLIQEPKNQPYEKSFCINGIGGGYACLV